MEIKAGCSQIEVVTGEPGENLKKIEAAARSFSEGGGGLLVLPEMWSCGFDYPKLRSMAERTPAMVEELRELARRYEVVLVGSLPEVRSEGGTVYNTSFAVDVTGEIAGRYRKMHLFSPHEEDLHFGRGDDPVVCETAVGRLGLMICYDLRFPELARRLALDGARFLCVSALWPAARVDHWSLLLRSRALENQMFAIGCNGCGRDAQSGMTFGGASAVVSPVGEVLAEGGNAENLVVAEGLRQEDMDDFRRRIPCFEDRRPGIYGLP